MEGHDVLWDYRTPYVWMQKVQGSSVSPMMIPCAGTGGGVETWCGVYR